MSKDWENAPKGFEDSDAPRAIEINRLIRASANTEKVVDSEAENEDEDDARESNEEDKEDEQLTSRVDDDKEDGDEPTDAKDKSQLF